MFDFLGGVSIYCLPVSRFGQRRIHRGGVVQGYFRLDLGRSGGAIATQSIFWIGAFFLTLLDEALEAAGVWIPRQQLFGIGVGCPQLLREVFLNFEVVTYHGSSTFSAHLFLPPAT